MCYQRKQSSLSCYLVIPSSENFSMWLIQVTRESVPTGGSQFNKGKEDTIHSLTAWGTSMLQILADAPTTWVYREGGRLLSGDSEDAEFEILMNGVRDLKDSEEDTMGCKWSLWTKVLLKSQKYLKWFLPSAEASWMEGRAGLAEEPGDFKKRRELMWLSSSASIIVTEMQVFRKGAVLLRPRRNWLPLPPENNTGAIQGRSYLEGTRSPSSH